MSEHNALTLLIALNALTNLGQASAPRDAYPIIGDTLETNLTESSTPNGRTVGYATRDPDLPICGQSVGAS
jgi:hypothetical protein